VTVTRVHEDGSTSPLGPETAALLAGPVQQFSSMISWAVDGAADADHADRETILDKEGRTLQRTLLQTTLALDTAREQRVSHLVSATGIRHGGVERDHHRGLISIFGEVRATRLAYRNRREANLYPADARWALPTDSYSMGMRALVAYHLATGGYGGAQKVIADRTGVVVRRAQLSMLAGDLARWTGDFYEKTAHDADDLAAGDVLMMQADGKGVAVRPEHRSGARSDATHPGIKKMAEIVSVATFTRRSAHRRTSPRRPPAAPSTPDPRREAHGSAGRSPRTSRR